jgi:serine phosphatase RsbU (regulator of sigma subunit)/anti-sigma regulatory factor (Ser/Thr protein kinase)
MSPGFYDFVRMADRIAEERLQALQSVTDAALSYLPLEEMLGELLTRVTELLDVDTAAILLLDDEGEALIPRAAKGLEEEVEARVRVPLGRGFAGRVAAQRTPVVINDVEHADIYNPILRQKGLKALLGVPLIVQNELTGVLHVGSLTQRDFDDDAIEVLQRASDRAAMAIGGRLAERERGLANAFQDALIPQLPLVPGMVLAGRYRPAAAAQLGGDWYDAFVLPTGAVAVAIGDVVGRGFHAAALMGQLRSAVRAYALDGKQPGELLESVSGLLRQLQSGWGATLLYAVLEPHRECLTVAAAGHPPPLVRDSEGSAWFVELPPSVPLAATRYPVYEQTEVDFWTGSTLILYTDGLVEKAGESLDDGLERLRSQVEGTTEDPQALAGHLPRKLVGTGTPDDVAILIVGVPRLPNPFAMTMPGAADSVPLVRRVITRWLHSAGASREEAEEITLACSEACANAIEHAYAPGETDFAVEVGSSGGEVTVVVRDTGQWREPRGLHRGRGMTMMKGLMDAVDVERSPQGTAVRLRRRLALEDAA